MSTNQPRATFPNQKPANPLSPSRHQPLHTHAPFSEPINPPPYLNTNNNHQTQHKENLFSLDRANSVINSLLQTVQTQSAQIKALQVAQGLSVGTGDIQQLFQKLNSTVDKLNARVSKLEHETSLTSPQTIEGGSPDPSLPPQTLGSLTLSNRRTLSAALNLLSEKASLSDLQTTSASLETALVSKMNKIEEESATLQSLNASLDIITQVSSRLDLIDSRLTLKVDKTEFESIKLDASILKTHRERISHDLERISFLEKTAMGHGGRIKDVEELSGRAVNHLTVMNERLPLLGSAQDVKEVTSAVKKMKSLIDSGGLISREEGTRINKNLELHGMKITTVSGVADTLVSTSGKIQAALKLVEDKCVSKQVFKGTLESYLQMNRYSRDQDEIKKELGAKAWVKHVKDIEESLAILTQSHTNTSQKAEMSIRFVKWYGDRGEVYENNLAAVDGHLKNLAVQSYTKKEPYDHDYE